MKIYLRLKKIKFFRRFEIMIKTPIVTLLPVSKRRFWKKNIIIFRNSHLFYFFCVFFFLNCLYHDNKTFLLLQNITYISCFQFFIRFKYKNYYYKHFIIFKKIWFFKKAIFRLFLIKWPSWSKISIEKKI